MYQRSEKQRSQKYKNCINFIIDIRHDDEMLIEVFAFRVVLAMNSTRAISFGYKNAEAVLSTLFAVKLAIQQIQEQVHIDLRSTEHVHARSALVLQFEQLLYTDVELLQLDTHEFTAHGEHTAVLRRAYLENHVLHLRRARLIDLHQHAFLLQLPRRILDRHLGPQFALRVHVLLRRLVRAKRTLSAVKILETALYVLVVECYLLLVVSRLLVQSHLGRPQRLQLLVPRNAVFTFVANIPRYRCHDRLITICAADPSLELQFVKIRAQLHLTVIYGRALANCRRHG